MIKLLDASYIWLDVVNMHYYYVDSRKKYRKVLTNFGVTSNSSGKNGKCISLTSDGQAVIVIGVFSGNTSTLVHECVHAGLFTLDYMGQELSYGDELLPYLVDTLVSKCGDKHGK